MTTPTKTVDEILEQYHPSYCNKYEVLRGLPPHDRRLTDKPCSCGFDKNTQSLRTLVEKAFDEVIGEDEPMKTKREDKWPSSAPYKRNILKNEQRQRAQAKLTEMFGGE